MAPRALLPCLLTLVTVEWSSGVPPLTLKRDKEPDSQDTMGRRFWRLATHFCESLSELWLPGQTRLEVGEFAQAT